MNPKIQEIFSNEEFVKSLLELENAEDVQKAVKEKGLDLSIEDIENIRTQMAKQQDGTLSDSDLEDVSGGSITLAAVAGIATVIGTIFGGVSMVDGLTKRRW